MILRSVNVIWGRCIVGLFRVVFFWARFVGRRWDGELLVIYVWRISIFVYSLVDVCLNMGDVMDI